jgi:NTP pyrophosphatase (non-canonical NTP hydrolase)
MNIQYTFDSYQEEASKTAIYKNKLIYPVLGLTGEAGEVANKVKKILRDKDGKLDIDDKDSICKELGDVLWYLAACATDLGLDMNDIAVKNLEKLNSRAERNTISGDGDNR